MQKSSQQQLTQSPPTPTAIGQPPAGPVSSGRCCRQAVRAAAGSGFAGVIRPSKTRRKQSRKQHPRQHEAAVQQEGQNEELFELSQAQHVITVPDFAPELCQQLRQVRRNTLAPSLLSTPSSSSSLHVVLAGERAKGKNPGTNNLGAKPPHQPVTGLSQIDHNATGRARYGPQSRHTQGMGQQHKNGCTRTTPHMLFGKYQTKLLRGIPKGLTSVHIKALSLPPAAALPNDRH